VQKISKDIFFNWFTRLSKISTIFMYYCWRDCRRK